LTGRSKPFGHHFNPRHILIDSLVVAEDALLFRKPGTRLTGEHELSEFVFDLDFARNRRLPAVRDTLIVSAEDERRSIGQSQLQLVVLGFQLPVFSWDDI